MKKFFLFRAFIGSLLWLDFYLADRTNDRILENSAEFEIRFAKANLDLFGERIQSCEIVSVYLLNAYQTCFVAWYGTQGDGIQGFRYVYHRPMPFFRFYGQSSESRYLSAMEYGISLKQVLGDGS